VHKISKTIVIMSFLAPLGANALGIGEIHLHSALNQTVSAEIPLVLSGDDALDEIQITLASPETFARAGIDRPSFLTKLRFVAIPRRQGGYAIQVTSTEVIREPFLNFLVEVNWPQGRILREFTVLLDPPVTMPESTLVVTKSPVLERPRDRSHQAEVKERTSEYPPTNSVGEGEYGPVRPNETLWGIAGLLNTDPSISQEQMAMALYRYNTRAFQGGKVNGLMAGTTLRVPDRTFILQIPTDRAQEEFYHLQGGGRGKLTNRNVGKSTASPKTVTLPPRGQLELLSPAENKSQREGAISGSESGDGKAKGDIALEVAETIKQENEEIRTRLAQLEQQLANMQRLLTLKDEQLAALQAQRMPTTPVVVPSEKSTPPKTETIPPSSPIPKTSAPPKISPSEQQITIPPQEPKAVIPKSAVKSEPKKPTPLPLPRTEPSFWGGFLEEPLYLAALGGSLGLLGFSAWLAARRRAALIAAETESFLLIPEENLPETPAPAPSPTFHDTISQPLVSTTKSSFLSEFSSSDFDALGSEVEEVDPISEADVYLAYGRYKQAEELIRNAIEQYPEREDCKLKLLEIHYATENRQAFEQYALELIKLKMNKAPVFWEKVVEMGRELLPEATIFNETSTIFSEARLDDTRRTFKPKASFDEDQEQLELPIDKRFASSNVKFIDLDELETSSKRRSSDQINTLDFDLTSWELDEEFHEEFHEESTSSDHSKEFDETHSLSFDLDEFKTLSSDLNVHDLTSEEVDKSRSLPFDLEDSEFKERPSSTTDQFIETSPEEEFDASRSVSFHLDDVEFKELTSSKIDSVEEIADIEINLDFQKEMEESPGKTAPVKKEVVMEEKTLTIDDLLRELEITESLDQSSLQKDSSQTTPSSVESMIEPIDLEAELATTELKLASEKSAMKEIEIFDLTDMDEMETKLDLAKAYTDMEDAESAQFILEEILLKGNNRQKQEAEELLSKLLQQNPRLAQNG
jgi:pilus assembly protein FimV